MIIRRSQYDALGRCGEDTFEVRLAGILAEQFPETATDASQLRNEIRLQIRASRSYGLVTEQQIATYVVAACALGHDFVERFPAAEQVFASGFLSAEEKTDWLDSWVHVLFA